MNSEAKHTPGPWISDYTGDKCDRFRFVITESGHIICRLRITRRENTEDNARLIAAAPELLAALQEVTMVLDAFLNVRGNEPDQDSISGRARAAIAKATGGAA